jgi:hypothetical protein
MVKKFKTFGPQLVFAEQAAGSVVALTNEQKLSLYKKSQKSGISTDVLEEVYRRGYSIWNESFGQTAEQFAFDRVNSFIAGGFAADLDNDLMVQEGKRGLWDNIHAKRARIKAGSGERMRKPGEKGAPTDASIRDSQNEDADPCWKGYEQIGTKTKNGRKVPNCVPVTESTLRIIKRTVFEGWQDKKYQNPTGGLTKAGVMAYRRENPGSKLQTAVTTKPSKLKPGSKAANRRKSFCARMSGMKKRLTSSKTANDPDSRINKSLRKWNC